LAQQVVSVSTKLRSAGERGASCESCDGEVAQEWRASGEAEAFQVDAFDFFGDGVA
jgi:hypothetical protein